MKHPRFTAGPLSPAATGLSAAQVGRVTPVRAVVANPNAFASRLRPRQSGRSRWQAAAGRGLPALPWGLAVTRNPRSETRDPVYFCHQQAIKAPSRQKTQ